MSFQSYQFIGYFIVVLIIYWSLSTKKQQNIFLIVSSYIFYGFFNYWFCIILFVSTVVNFVCAPYLRTNRNSRRVLFFFLLIYNIGQLGLFKYYNFFISDFNRISCLIGFQIQLPVLKILLPIGISFYTFQMISYIVDVYRGDVTPSPSFIDFALFVAIFPKIVAGPIEKSKDLLPQIYVRRKWEKSLFYSGSSLILQGYVKKLVVADNVGVFSDKIFMLDCPTYPVLFVGALAFTIQIYADFSGYTDIARGAALLLGIKLSENFNSPYLAISPSDFWRRWHMTLSRWIRDYIFIPLGGSKTKSRSRLFFNLVITMGLCGIWHGAAWTYLIWGLYYGVLLFIYHSLGFGGRWRPISRLGACISWTIMVNFVITGWIIFRAPDVNWLLNTAKNFSFHIASNSSIVFTTVLLYLIFYGAILSLLKILQFENHKSPICSVVFKVSCLLIIVIMFNENPQDYIYSQF